MKVTLGIRGKKYYKIPPRPFVTNNVMFCPVWENYWSILGVNGVQIAMMSGKKLLSHYRLQTA